MGYKITDIDPVTMSEQEIVALIDLLMATKHRKQQGTRVMSEMFSGLDELLKMNPPTKKDNNKDLFKK